VLPHDSTASPLRENISHFEYAPITGVHLWFNRQISDLDHAVLLDRTIQWMFHKSRLLEMRSEVSSNAVSSKNHVDKNELNKNVEGHDFSRAVKEPKKTGALPPQGSYIELVISSSKSLIEKSRSEIIELVLNEVREFFPDAREANLLKSTVIKEVKATYSPRPGIDAYRPSQRTSWPRVFLAGDWTATGWPATMEGAVRSGYLAADALMSAAGRPTISLTPDLRATGLMRFFV
jgi:uncharacterized protein with NAD-binding domain and iron-sulfur cluster